MSFFESRYDPSAGPNPYLVHGRVPAGFWRRVLATLVDGLVVGLLSVLLAKLIEPTISVGNITAGAALYHAAFVYTSLQLIINVSYQVIMVGRSPGRTIGDFVTGIQVVGTDMFVPGYTRSSKRVLIDLAATGLAFTPASSLGSMLFLVDGLWMLFDRDRQTLHDKIAQTYVIRVLPRQSRTSDDTL